ncbi:alpha/beta hydrolase [Streptomyces tubbatahanensis]|uniref:Alpha/beta hydrolase n=1 Tax=Streptomyces tubbatahanensis TaxID=2923272 RepID=A0ABY3XZY2_9ACTN|nr:alpha/beta hydrolase [Streptomyces tubbatahanensis]UNT00055.1 alpha/beta hydrolase [Streptomyces tubbatahanensis]
MKTHRNALALTLAVSAVTATLIPGGASAATPDAAPGTPAGTLRWGHCPTPRASPQAGAAARLECATLKVPLDYRHPHGRQIDIAVSRLASGNPAKRRGVLLTNPGGPGAPGLTYPAVLAASGLPQSVLDSYDVIGFDARGAGRSTPVTCDLTPSQQQRGNFPVYARSAADVDQEAAHARAIARQCATSRSAWMLPHTTTANNARDMDRIRAALGEREISYLGASYGTHLGAVYATLFPQRGDRIVLDSNLGPGGYDRTAFRRLARGMHDRFPDFAAYAAEHPRYGLGRTPGQVTATYHRLAARLTAHPVGIVDGTSFRGLTFDRLYSDASMPALAKAWQDLDRGEPIRIDPPEEGFENLLAGRHHVLCADSPWPRKLDAYRTGAAVDRVRYPMLGGSTGSVTPCAFWPRKGIEKPVRIGDRGPSNMLMVQNERDPGTPLAGALSLRRALGARARMVSADQGGHGVYPFGRNTCVKDAATAFLATGERPARDRSCPSVTAETS